MAAYAQRAGWFGWIGGGFAAEKQIQASNGSTAVLITYGRALRSGPDFAQFTATVNGTARGVTAASIGGTGNARLNLTLASATVTGDKVVVTYTPGGTPATRFAYASPVEEMGAGVLASTAV